MNQFDEQHYSNDEQCFDFLKPESKSIVKRGGQIIRKLYSISRQPLFASRNHSKLLFTLRNYEIRRCEWATLIANEIPCLQ
jgi:hypothetical protein